MRIYSFLLLLVLSLFADKLASVAQTSAPQYQRARLSGGTGGSVLAYYNPPFDSAVPRRFQCVYPRKFFPMAPAGYIKNIYFWGGSNKFWPTKGTIYDVRIKMGYTKQDTFKRINSTTFLQVRDTFITGLTTVFTADSVVEDLKNNFRYWLKFPLQGSGFYYTASPEQNLVVEFSFGSPWVKEYFSLLDSAGGGAQLMLIGYRDSSAVQIHRLSEQAVGVGGCLDFGFDIGAGPNAVQTFSSVSCIGDLYPNPAGDVIRIPVSGYYGPVTVTITDGYGKEISKHTYRMLDSAKELTIRTAHLTAGVYFVTFDIGGTVVQRRFSKL